MNINCNGTLIDLSTPRVMGILNLSPDSFYQSHHGTTQEMLKKVEQMLVQGADFIDVGGYSSRPNAPYVSQEDEAKRIIEPIRQIIAHFPEAKISVDTFRADIAQEVLDMGVSIINDISAGQQDTKMMEIVSKYQAVYVMMHMRGTPQDMILHTDYDDLLKDIIYFFSERINRCRQFGINDIMIDPGFGFSKNIAQNYTLFSNLKLLTNILDLPILIGISRKSMIYKLLEITPEESLNATTALHLQSLFQGANILRVHDIIAAKQTITLHQQLNKCQ